MRGRTEKEADARDFPLLSRSPWSNEYDPATDEGIKPSDKLRKVEVEGNEVFQQYCGQ